jgi:hypothetical protein
MFKSGVALTLVGLAVAATGLLAIRSVSMPLPGGWHLTLFLPGIGALVGMAGVAIVAWSRLTSSD